MTINTIKITQLVPIGTGLDANSTLPIVDLTGDAITRKTTAGNLANLILSSAGGNFSPAGQALTAQTVTNAAQPNITSVGTLSSLTVTGNTTLGAYVSATYFVGDVIGNVSNANYSNFAGTVTSSAQPNITSVGTLTDLDVSGNITALYADIAHYVTANYYAGDGGFLTNVRSLTANTVINNHQPNITSLGILTSLSVSGNANIGNIGAINGVFTNVSGNGALLTDINGANVVGIVANAAYAANAGNAIAATTAETVTNNAQPNITSVGTLTSLSVSGNVTSQYFIGNGSLLTGITSNSANANYASFAGEAFSVAAGNIVGNVQYANTAFSVDGSNVSGAVAQANIANNVVGTVKVPFSYSTISPLNLVEVSAGSVVTEVSLIITVPFNGTNPTTSVGDSSNVNRLLSTTDCLANEVGTYTVSPVYNYASTTQLILTLNSGGSTAGEGLIIINYE